MEKFVKPDMEIVLFDTEDILTASAEAVVPDMGCGDCANSPGGICDWHACGWTYDPFG